MQSHEHNKPQLIEFSTGRIIRDATAEEHTLSQKMIEVDGIGIINVDGVDCYTETDTTL